VASTLLREWEIYSEREKAKSSLLRALSAVILSSVPGASLFKPTDIKG